MVVEGAMLDRLRLDLVLRVFVTTGRREDQLDSRTETRRYDGEREIEDAKGRLE